MPSERCTLTASDTDAKSTDDLSVGPHFCSMKITQDVRKYAAQKQIDEQAALGVGMKEKAEEFIAAGSEIYQGMLRQD